VVRTELPGGTVTFLFTDVEGSTDLLLELGSEAYAEALAEHRRVVRDACSGQGGVEVDTQGDAFFFAFPTAPEAVEAARAIGAGLAAGRIKVRVGVHTGTPLLVEEGYVGSDVHRAARIAAAGHGGQVLVSSSTAALLSGDGVRDLGEHRFKDLAAPERVYQLGFEEYPPLNTLYQANLPVQPTSLVGRTRELAEAAAMLQEHRLVTLVGPGGSGKTRLALQVAADAAGEFEHGVWWAPLAPLADAELVESAVAQAVGAKGDLVDYLRPQRALLLLDNFEHLLSAAPRVAELLRDAPDLKVLATSRAPLRLSGEYEYPVPPLAEDEAVALFTERARAVKPRIEPDEHVRSICRRLDGLPLALELAAARVRILPPAKLAQRLEHALPLLAGGTRDAPQRQRTLRATIQWSYELLGEEEKRLLDRLAVFSGSFSLEAAEAVCEAPLDLLQGLVEQNLLRETGTARFFFLETIREFALERLDARGETAAMRSRHAEFFVELAEAAEPRITQVEVLATLAEDEANFRTALSYGGEHAPQLMLRLVALLWRSWYYRGYYEEAQRWLEHALELDRDGSSLARAHALRGLAAVVGFRPDHAERALSLNEEAIALHRQHGDDEGLLRCLNNLGVQLISTDVDPDLDRAREALEECIALNERLAAQGHATSLAFPLGNLASIALRRGNLLEARRLSEQELEAARDEHDDVSTADAQGTLAWIAALEGRYTEAARLLQPALEFSLEIGSRWPSGSLALAAVIGTNRGQLADAAKMFGAIDEQRAKLGMPWWSESKVSHAIEAAERKLADEGFSEAREEGRELTFEERLEIALRLSD
jgi:predicted ATPase